MSQHSHKYGGLGLGTTGTSYSFLGCILALVSYLSLTRRDVTEGLCLGTCQLIGP
jgi:uncharacterized membrane-anchored protein